jgi:hypothetical protein
LIFQLSTKPPCGRFDFIAAGTGTGFQILRDNANRVPTLIRRIFQDAPQRPIVIYRRSSGREAAKGCGRVSVSILTGGRADLVQRVAYCGVPSGPPRIEHCGEDSISGETVWIDGVVHSVRAPRRRLARLEQISPAIVFEQVGLVGFRREPRSRFASDSIARIARCRDPSGFAGASRHDECDRLVGEILEKFIPFLSA